jgi:DNA-binding PadR family transcriptional regulator
MSKSSDLAQDTLDMLLLKILVLVPINGFAVSQRLKQMSGDVLQVSDGSLYPALRKLEQKGWITAEWNVRVWAAREISFADKARAGTARKRSRQLGQAFERHFAGYQA